MPLEDAVGSLVLSATPLEPRPRVVTIGSFDGVHRGHQALLRDACARARDRGFGSLAVTFEPLPPMVLRPDRFPGRICPADAKLRYLAASGVDEILTITFDRALAGQSPEAFMAALQRETSLRELWVGEAFALGKNRVGNVARLTGIGAERGFEVVAVARLTNGHEVISSSAIREAIAEGAVDRAGRLLGRPFQVAGEVVHGAHLGRQIGYPTANVAPPPELVPLADGIYAAQAVLQSDDLARPAMTYVGTRPTVNSGPRYIETHILDFDGDLYGQTLTVDVLQRLRADETFAGLDALIEQLRRDEARTRTYFESREEPTMKRP